MLFRYTETPLKTGFLPQGSCGLAIGVWGIRKTVPFRTPADRLAVALSMSALRPKADVIDGFALCPQMTLCGHWRACEK